MTAKGKTGPVTLSVQYPQELWDEMVTELKRRVREEHRDDSIAGFIRESIRVNLAAIRDRLAKVA